MQVVLPYSLEAFTEAVQDTFKIALAATASAGCECKIAKTDVDITRTTENAAPAGTRRRLHAASITVDVSILVPDAKTGSLLVQSDALSREAMNDELVKRGLEPITQVTSSPALKSQDEHASALDSGDAASAGGASGAAVAIGITVPVAVIMLACAGWYFVRTRKKIQGTQREDARKQREEEAQRSRDEETRRREEEEARKRRETQVLHVLCLVAEVVHACAHINDCMHNCMYMHPCTHRDMHIFVHAKMRAHLFRLHGNNT